MGKYRFEARTFWKEGNEVRKHTGIPIEYYATGDGVIVSPAQRSDHVRDFADLVFLTDLLEDSTLFTIFLKPSDANAYFRPNWEIHELVLGAYDGKVHVRSVACNRPTRKRSAIDKGVQRITFEISSPFNRYMP